MFEEFQETVEYEAATLANELLALMKVDAMLWKKGTDYKPGDVIYGSLYGVMIDEKY
jgi:hypothetical protein